MYNVVTFKGFIGSVQFSAEDNVFFGKIEGINDLVTFEGETVQELNDAFRYVVEEHIKDCEAQQRPAEKSYKGSFNVRITPNLHRRVAVAAKMQGKSLNSFVKRAVERELEYV